MQLEIGFQICSSQKIILRWGLLFIAALLLAACGLRAPLPDCCTDLECKKVKVDYGTEDFVLDQWQTSPRLLISSHERREPAENGRIYAYDIESSTVIPMQRSGEKNRIITFKPHGMDIRRSGDKTLLYVIVHDPHKQKDRFQNGIAVYEVLDDEIVLMDLLENADYLWSPNDLSVMSDGTIYATNDYRGDLDLYLKRKSSQIAHFNPISRKWTLAAEGLGLANGILALKDRVYIATTLENRLFVFPRKSDGSLGPAETITTIKGLDNIMTDGDRLLVAAHFDDLAFMKHRDNVGAVSPTVIFRVDPVKKNHEPVYVNADGTFNAASTAFIYKGKLYMSQVFDPYLQVCDF